MKLAIRQIITLIFTVLIAQTSISQENYESGYLINLNGDTIHGFIDYRNWERNPDKIFFKESTDHIRSIYHPTTIQSFSVSDEIYESAIINTEENPINAYDSVPNEGYYFANDTTFLQALIKGKKSLYFYKNKRGEDKFYIKTDTSYEYLVYKKYLHRSDGQTGYVENKKFVGQLLIYLQDCPTIQSKLKKTEYRKKSLLNLFHAYYDCTKVEIGFQKKTEKAIAEIGITAGISLTSLMFRSEGFDYLVNADFGLSTNFSAGLFADVILPRSQGKWSIYNELLYTTYLVTGRYENYFHANRYTIYNTEIGYSYLKIINMLRFKYPIGNYFLYINAGMSNGIAVSETNVSRAESKFFDIQNVIEAPALEDTRKYEQGFIVGLGTKFKKYSLDIRYEIGNGMSQLTSLNSSTKRYYFLFGYRF